MEDRTVINYGGSHIFFFFLDLFKNKLIEKIKQNSSNFFSVTQLCKSYSRAESPGKRRNSWCPWEASMTAWPPPDILGITSQECQGH